MELRPPAAHRPALSTIPALSISPVEVEGPKKPLSARDPAASEEPRARRHTVSKSVRKEVSPARRHRLQTFSLHSHEDLALSEAMSAIDSAASPPSAIDEHPLRHKRSSSAIRDLGSSKEMYGSPRFHEHQNLYKLPEQEPVLYKHVHNPTAPVGPPEHDAPFGTTFSLYSDMEPRKRQKRRSVRAAIRKIFAKKSREKVQGPPAVRHEYHRSEPFLYTASSMQSANEEKNVTRPDTRELSFSDKEFTRPNPLASHLPFPMNVNAPQSSSPRNTYSSLTPSSHGRRATLPSLVFASEEDVIASALGKSGTRVISTDGQSLTRPDSEQSIGVAVTHNRQSRRQSNRRSRSASALKEYARENSLEIAPRRSAEIRYWRASLQSNQTRKDQPSDMQDEPSSPKSIPVPQSELPLVSSESTVLPIDSAQADQPSSIGPENQQAQSFDFGQSKPGADSPQSTYEPMKEELDVAIPLTSDERIAQLEASMRNMALSMQRLQARTNRQTIIFSNPPPGRQRSRDASASSASRSSSTHETTNAATGPPAPYHALNPSFPQPSTAPTESHTSICSPNQLHNQDRDRVTALYTLLSHERSARKGLEAQVITLQTEIQQLRSYLSSHIIRRYNDDYNNAHMHAYPTPSPDQVLFSHSNSDADLVDRRHHHEDHKDEKNDAWTRAIATTPTATTITRPGAVTSLVPDRGVRKSDFSFESADDDEAETASRTSGTIGGPVGSRPSVHIKRNSGSLSSGKEEGESGEIFETPMERVEMTDFVGAAV